jgi:AcrR family transcriptional regulator
MNKVISTDRRVQRTRQALREALLSLMKEKDYNAITVEEITARANLGRTTFYLHYQDKEALLLEKFADLIQELVREISQVSVLEWQQQQKIPQRPVLMIFQHVAENEELYQLILGGEGIHQATDRLRSIFVEAANELAQTKGEVQQLIRASHLPFHFLAHYFSGALIATIGWWLEGELVYTPVQIAALFQQMLFPGIEKVVGLAK